MPKEWNIIVVPCPLCGVKEKHPMEDQESILVKCFRCGRLFHLDKEGNVRNGV